MSDKIEILNIVENKDGSATINFECDEETRKFLIGLGLLRIIEHAIEKYEEE